MIRQLINRHSVQFPSKTNACRDHHYINASSDKAFSYKAAETSIVNKCKFIREVHCTQHCELSTPSSSRQPATRRSDRQQCARPWIQQGRNWSPKLLTVRTPRGTRGSSRGLPLRKRLLTDSSTRQANGCGIQFPRQPTASSEKTAVCCTAAAHHLTGKRSAELRASQE